MGQYIKLEPTHEQIEKLKKIIDESPRYEIIRISNFDVIPKTLYFLEICWVAYGYLDVEEWSTYEIGIYDSYDAAYNMFASEIDLSEWEFIESNLECDHKISTWEMGIPEDGMWKICIFHMEINKTPKVFNSLIKDINNDF